MIFIKRILPPLRTIWVFPVVSHFSNNLYKVPQFIQSKHWIWWDSFFLKWCLNGGGRSTTDDAMPSSPSSALFFCTLTYSFLCFMFNNRHIGPSGFTVFILLRWFGKTRVPSCQIRVTNCELKAYNHELKFKIASSNQWIMSWNPQVTSWNKRATSSNPRVTSSNLRLISSNPRVTSLNLRAMSTISQLTSSNRRIEMKTHGNSLTN